MKEKTIKMPNSFGKEIEVTKKEWVARWQDCTVKSLRGFFLEDEYKSNIDTKNKKIHSAVWKLWVKNS